MQYNTSNNLKCSVDIAIFGVGKIKDPIKNNLRGFDRAKLLHFSKDTKFWDFTMEYKYILFPNNCKQLDPQIFIESAIFAILISMLTSQ